MSSPIETFEQLGLPAFLLSALQAVGYETPSPIQAACIPPLLDGHDLLGEAQTGTGKTAAFALPLLAGIDLAEKRPQALVLAPTRELAIQVAEALQKYASQMPGFHVLPLYGGQSMVIQLRALSRGAHVIVGTPGRIMDHLERKSLSLDKLKMLVLDEADEMLRMGFIDDVEWILEHTPAERQTALFSATMPEPIRRVARHHLREPQEVKIKAATTTNIAVRQRYWQVSGLAKMDALTRILETEEDFDAGIVFVRTKTATVELVEKLEARGHAAAALNGDMPQALRERVIEQLKNGRLDLVVATDVAARGIDVPRVSHVINYDIPYDTEAYVHRIGRTGRAGRTGTAILFVAPREKRMLRDIERATRQPIEPMALPTLDAVAQRRVAQFKQQVMAVMEGEDLEFFENMVGQLAREKNVEPVEIAAALAWIAQGERPLLPEGWKPGMESEPASVEFDDAPSRREREYERPFEREGGREREQRPAKWIAPKRFSFIRYRINVGRDVGVMPKDIVGAIANEAGIESRCIGQINLFDNFSIVELPDSLPEGFIRLLAKVRVKGKPLDIAVDDGSGDIGGRPERKPREFNRDERPAREERPFRKDGPPSFNEGAKKPYGEKSYGDKPPFKDKPYKSSAPRSFEDSPRPARPKWESGKSDGPKPEGSRPFSGERPARSGKPPFPGSKAPSFGGSKPPRKPKRG